VIDDLILSRPHRDHVELLPDLFAAYQVREVWDSGRVNDICGYRAFIEAVRDEPGVKYHNAIQGFGTWGYTFESGTCYGRPVAAETVELQPDTRITHTPIILGQGASMTVLRADATPFSNVNDNSLVVQLDLGTTSFCSWETPRLADAPTRPWGQPSAPRKVHFSPVVRPNSPRRC